MVITAVPAVADAIEPSPSGISLHGLDGVNLFLAGALSGFGPYVAAFLAEQNWTQQDIGFVLTAAGFVGSLSRLPGGAGCSGRTNHRSLAEFPAGVERPGLQGITGGFLGLAIAAISLGLVGHAALAEQLGRNQRFASTGGVVAAGLMGLVAYFLSYRAIFFVAAALVLPLLAALGRIRFRPRLVRSESLAGSTWRRGS